MIRKIQTTEAKRRWSEFPRKVESCDSIAITRYGKTIAHLIPGVTQDRIQRKKAVEEFRRSRAEGEKIKATLEEMLQWRHEGHRF